jgi:hypothetical protein
MLKPFWCYYGGKWRSAPHYPAPRHDLLIEPFAGAAGYATRHHKHRVVLVEADPVVAELWRWLIGATEADVLALPAEVPTTVRDLGLPPGPSALIGFWIGKGGAVPRQSSSAWMRQGLNPSGWWGVEVRARIAAQVGAIKHWTLIEGSYEAAPDEEATWYIDPPYQRAGTHYRKRIVDYAALGAWCRTRRGQVIVCEEQGADWLPFEPFGSFKASPAKHGGKRCAEAVWLHDTTIPLKLGDRVRVGEVFGDGPHDSPGWATHGTEGRTGEIERIDYDGETARVRLDGDGVLHWYPVSILERP